MVRKLLSVLHQEVRGLHEAAFLLGFFALLSQILGLLRDRLLAHFFGAGPILDVYFAAFRIPDLVFVSIASLVSIYVLIPFIEERAALSREAVRAFISSVFSGFLILMFFVSALLFLFAEPLLSVLFPGFVGGPYFETLVALTRLLLIQPILLGLSNLFGSITQTRQKFLLYALSPILYNVGIIIGIIFFYPTFGIMGLGLGVLLGAMLHVGIQLPFILTSGVAPRFALSHIIPDLRSVVVLSLPRTLALSANQLVILIFVAIASLMTVGSITIFQFAYNLQAVPLSIIAVSYSVAAFPTLSRFYTSGDRSAFLSHITTAARHILFWSLPAIAFFIVLRAHIVRVIFGSGAFDWTDTRLTAAALALFIVSLFAQGLSMLFARGYYAAGNTKTPLVINIASALCALLFAFGFLKLYEVAPMWRFFIESLLRVEGLPGTEILMLPLGYTLALIGNALLFFVVFRKDFDSHPRELFVTFFEGLSAAVVLGFVTHQFLDVFDDFFDLNTAPGIFLQGFLSGLIGIAAALLVLRLLQSKELDATLSALRRRFWKVQTVAAEQTEL